MKRLEIMMFLAILALANACQQDPYREGARLYRINCANCHGENGMGLGMLIPPLAQSDFLSRSRQQLPCILVKGLSDSIVVNGQLYWDQPMPANPLLSDVHTSNLLNYIGHSWGNNEPEFTLDEVRKALSQCK